MTAVFVSCDAVLDPEFIKLVGEDAVTGIYLTFAPDPRLLQSAASLIRRYELRYGSLGPYVLYVYDAVGVLLQAIQVLELTNDSAPKNSTYPAFRNARLSALPVGWAETSAPDNGQEHLKRAGRRAGPPTKCYPAERFRPAPGISRRSSPKNSWIARRIPSRQPICSISDFRHGAPGVSMVSSKAIAFSNSSRSLD